MKILLTERQYFKLLLEQQVDIEFPKDITVRFTGFAPDTYKQRTFVYLNEMPKDDVLKLKELKDNNVDIIVKLNNILNHEIFEFPLNKINFTKASGIPYIFNTEYDKIKGELKTHKVVLDANFLKKKNSGFPEFILNTLYKLYPNNIGKNSFINGNGICESEDGLINIPNTNVPGEIWSILNYFDTNPMVIKKLIEWYMMGEFDGDITPTEVTIENFENWITTNSNKLFKEGSYLDVLVKLNLTSYTSGAKTENLTIKNLTQSPYNLDSKNIKQYCSGNKLDRWDSKDIEIITKNGVYYAQIKPLKWVKIDEITNEYIINSYQMKNYKSKPVNYIIFTNPSKMLIFKNSNYKVENNDFAIFKNPPVTNID